MENVDHLTRLNCENNILNHNVSLINVSAIVNFDVCNANGEDLGCIKEIILNTDNGKALYAILAFGGIWGIGKKFFAVPWSDLKFDVRRKHFVLNIYKDRLNYVQGFDKKNWPDITTCF